MLPKSIRKPCTSARLTPSPSPCDGPCHPTRKFTKLLESSAARNRWISQIRRERAWLQRSRRLPPVRRPPDPAPATIQHVRVDHRRAHVLVAEELLHRADVVAVLEKVRGERVAQAVTG